MTDLKSFLVELNKNLNILKEREAKYAGNAPLELLNQINDHEQAINLTEQAIAGEITQIELHEAVKPLLLAVANGHVVNIKADYRPPLQRPPRVEYFIGRENELTRILTDLQSGRAVTLCGPGGIGKTALATEAIWALAPGDVPPEMFPDGIIYHSFYNQPQADLALESIARIFGEEPKPTPRDAAQRALSGRRVLLFLDGTEKADDLQAVLEIRGKCGLIVTSRNRRDAVAGRQDVKSLAIDEAIELLRAWRGEQAVDAITAGKICKLVGGLPLAIRLVGRYLAETEETADEYLVWLEKSPLHALDLGERRLQSVRVLLTRSFVQVSENSTKVMAVVGLLALKPFSREIISVALDTPEDNLNRSLGELVSYSVLQRTEQQYQVSHALIHTFARDNFVSATSEVINRLAAHYITLADMERSKNSYMPLDNEREHIMHVLTNCVNEENWIAANDLVRAIDMYLLIRGYPTDRIAALEMGVTAAQNLKDRWYEGRWIGLLADAYDWLGQDEKSIPYYHQGVSIFQETDDHHLESITLGSLGNAYRNLGQFEKAIECYKEALVLSRDVGDLHWQRFNLDNLAFTYFFWLGQVDQATYYYKELIAISQETSTQDDETDRLKYLAKAYLALNNLDQALICCQQALAISRENDDRNEEVSNLRDLGKVYEKLEQTNQALDCYQQALYINQEIGDRRDQCAIKISLGSVYHQLGQSEYAIENYTQALTIAREINDPIRERISLYYLGLIYRYSLSKNEEALNYFQQALTISRSIGNRQTEGSELGELGNIYRDLGKVELGIEHYQQALTIAREIGDRRNEANWLRNLGCGYTDLRQVDQAINYFEQALAISHEIVDFSQEYDNLWMLGHIYRQLLQQPEQAIEYYQQAFGVTRKAHYRSKEGSILGALGNVYRELEQIEEAINSYQQALIISRELGNREDEGNILSSLARTHRALAQIDQATQFYEQAISIYREIGDRKSEAYDSWNLGLIYEDVNPAKAIELMSVCVVYEREIDHPDAEADEERIAQIRVRLGD